MRMLTGGTHLKGSLQQRTKVGSNSWNLHHLLGINLNRISAGLKDSKTPNRNSPEAIVRMESTSGLQPIFWIDNGDESRAGPSNTKMPEKERRRELFKDNSNDDRVSPVKAAQPVKEETLKLEELVSPVKAALQGPKPMMKCSICPMLTSTKESLKRHIAVKHDMDETKQTVSNICKLTFANKANANRHIRTVHEKKEPDQLCPKCGFISTDPSSFKQQIARGQNVCNSHM